MEWSLADGRSLSGWVWAMIEIDSLLTALHFQMITCPAKHLIVFFFAIHNHNIQAKHIYNFINVTDTGGRITVESLAKIEQLEIKNS